MSNHYILRVGNSNNFKNSSNVSIWAVKPRNKSFLKKVKEGDKLWFVKNKEKCDIHNGKIIAVADFVSKNKRDRTDDELNWDKKGANYTIEIQYNNLYNLTDCNLFTGQNNQTTICEYNHVKNELLVNLITEYEYIYKYSKITTKM
jgi:hypothetical protein